MREPGAPPASIRPRLGPMLALAAAIALLAAGVVVAIQAERVYAEQKVREATVQAQILASSVSAALAFDDQEAAQSHLNALSANPEIEIAAIYGQDGELFATYLRDPDARPPERVERRAPALEDRLLTVVAEARQADASLGLVYLQTRTEPLAQRLWRYLGIGLLAGMAALVVAVLGIAQSLLARANRQLERRVGERTRELSEVNENLRAEIAERERAEAQKQMLMAELEHRVKNALTVANSLVHHTRASSRSIDEFAAAFSGRLRAMGRALELLVRGSWRGAELGELLHETVRPYQPRPDALELSGPRAQLPPAMASSLAMILHELATNAAKYGAWSNESGSVSAQWTLAGDELTLDWRERGGPPVKPPVRQGFGTRMIRHNPTYELGGSARLDFLPEGLRCQIVFRLPGTAPTRKPAD